MKRILEIVVFALAISMNLFAQAPVSGRRAFWRMEGNTLDIQGGNTGQLPIGATFVPDRNNIGKAIYVNSANPIIPIAQVGTSLDLRRFTIAAWVKLDPGTPDGLVVIEKRSVNYPAINYFLLVRTGSNLLELR